MNRSLMAIGFFILLSGVALACTSGQTPAEQRASTLAATKPEASAKPAWEQDWERTLKGARDEGRLVIYTGYGSDFRQAFGDAMKTKYGVTLEAVAGRTEEVMVRLAREQQNRVHNGDVATLSINYLPILKRDNLLQPMEQLLVLPEVVDAKGWYREQIVWLDPDEKTTATFREAVNPPWVINTDLVKAGDLKSWNDLLAPSWKAKILMNDPTLTGGGQSLIIWLGYSIMDWDFVRALLKQEPNVQRDNRLMVEWVARGRYPILLGPRKEEPFQFMQAGAPIKFMVPKEGTYLAVGDGAVAQLRTSPHPNAAKVFINFLLGREGQTIMARTSGYESSRVDIPTDYLDPATVRQPGVKYVSQLDAGFREQELELRKEAVKIFEAYLRK
ncbi:MAG: extracellular solute-binding protein [Chloroflexi bacterium]|nr:extracellular solute-binding protein [Chloroflexota bacterium]